MKAVLFLCFALFLSSCIVLPVPRHRNGNRIFITKQMTEFIQPDHTTREEILLKLGDPDKEACSDKVFIYRWDVTWGYYFAAGYYAGVAGPVTSRRYFLVGFNNDSTVAKTEFGHPDFFRHSKTQGRSLNEVMREWLKN